MPAEALSSFCCLYCRHCANPDVYCDRVSQSRPEEFCFQLCSYADEARVPQQNRRQVQKEDRGNGQASSESYFHHLMTLHKCIFQNAAANVQAQ